MYVNNTSRKIISIILSFLFVFIISFGPPSMPASAVVSTATVVAAVAIASLIGWGVVTVCNGLTAQDVDSWMVEELGLWAATQNTTYDQLIPESGISVNAIGDFLLTPTAALGLTQFDQWLISKYGVTAGGASVPVVEPGVTINGYTLYKHVQWRRRNYPDVTVGITCEGDCAAMITNVGEDGYTRVVVIRYGTNGSAHYDGGNNVQLTRYGSTNCYYYSSTVANQGVTLLWSNVPLSSYSKAEIMDGTGGYESREGSLDLVPDTNINIPVGESAEKDTNISWGGSTGMTVQSAADTILNQVVDNSLNVTITQTGEGVDNPTQVWPEVDRPIGVEGLASVFPFCIPFDIVDFLSLLEAERQTPVFDFELVIVPLGIDEHVVLDFSMFNDLAAMVRTAELFLFIVGLAVVTRQIFAKG